MLQDNVLYCVDLSVNVDDVFDVDVDVEVHNFVLYRFEDFEPHKRIFFSYVKESHVFSYDEDTSLCKKTLTHTVTIIHQIYRETVEKLALEISSRQVIFDKKEMVKSNAHTFL